MTTKSTNLSYIYIFSACIFVSCQPGSLAQGATGIHKSPPTFTFLPQALTSSQINLTTLKVQHALMCFFEDFQKQ